MERKDYICKHYDEKRETCMFNKRLVMEFLNSVGAVIKNGPKRVFVDTAVEWTKDDWKRYEEMNSKLATGIHSVNFCTGIVGCGNNGVNQFCDQWDSLLADEYRKAQAENPDQIIIVNTNLL